MPYILLILLGGLLLILLSRKITNENSKPLMQLLKWLAFILCALSGVYFAVTGRIGFVAAIFIVMAWYWGKDIKEQYKNLFHPKQIKKTKRKKTK